MLLPHETRPHGFVTGVLHSTSDFLRNSLHGSQYGLCVRLYLKEEKITLIKRWYKLLEVTFAHAEFTNNCIVSLHSLDKKVVQIIRTNFLYVRNLQIAYHFTTGKDSYHNSCAITR